MRGKLVAANTLLFSIDINSLYTNISTELGLRAVREAFDKYPDPARLDSALLELLHLGLTRNDFVFNGQWVRPLCRYMRTFTWRPGRRQSF